MSFKCLIWRVAAFLWSHEWLQLFPLSGILNGATCQHKQGCVGFSQRLGVLNLKHKRQLFPRIHPKQFANPIPESSAWIIPRKPTETFYLGLRRASMKNWVASLFRMGIGLQDLGEASVQGDHEMYKLPGVIPHVRRLGHVLPPTSVSLPCLSVLYETHTGTRQHSPS